ncbi:hypothetical protein SNEBB_009526 [Seison nebaliae]|nr:hypothetical protein SNEBB_009526 [Seison nebaliae]
MEKGKNDKKKMQVSPMRGLNTMGQEENHDMVMITRKEMQTVMENIQHSVHWTKAEIEALLIIFSKLTNGYDRMDRIKFRDLIYNTFDMTGNSLSDRVFRAFDSKNEGWITMRSWLTGMSVFLRGTLDEQIKFCYTVYDITGERYILREEIYPFFKNCIVYKTADEDPDDVFKDLVELIMRKMDLDADGRISFNDYRESVIKEPLLLQCLGQCLPDLRSRDAFLATFTVMNSDATQINGTYEMFNTGHHKFR